MRFAPLPRKRARSRSTLTRTALALILIGAAQLSSHANAAWPPPLDATSEDMADPANWPNHPGYADFRLTLEGVSHGGEAEWRDRLRAHWETCEPEWERTD